MKIAKERAGRSRQRPPLLVLAVSLSLAAGCGSSGGGAPSGGSSGGGGDAGVQPAFAPTFANVNSQVFQMGCALSACHAPPVSPAVGNLDLKTNAYAALLGADGGGVPASDVAAPYNYGYNGMLLIAPGDPEHSLLYQKVHAGLAAGSGCVQGPGVCQYGEHMPNLPGQVLGAGVVEAIREWIAQGAAQ